MNSQPPSDPRPPQNSPLGFDEIIAIIIVLLTMGTVFWAAFPRSNQPFLGKGDLEKPLFKLDDSADSTAEKKVQPQDQGRLGVENRSQTGAIADPTGNVALSSQPGRTKLGDQKSSRSFSSVFLTMFGLSQASKSAFTTEARELPRSQTALAPIIATPTPEGALSPVVPVPVPVPLTEEVPVTPTPTPTVIEAVPVAPTPTEQPTLSLPLEEKAREANPQEKVTFSDVPQGYWARPMIIALAQRDIITGFPDGTFRPSQPVTRAEFATMIQKTFAAKKVQNRLQFKDVASDFWAVPQINEATETGFMRGYPNNLFNPAQNIPRVQVLVSLANGLGLKPKNEPVKTLQMYQDAASIPQYALDEVAAVTELGLQYSNPDLKQLNPNQEATRADIANLLYQALVVAGEAPKLPVQ